MKKLRLNFTKTQSYMSMNNTYLFYFVIVFSLDLQIRV